MIKEDWLTSTAPEPVLSLSQWSDQYRVLSSKSASEPGYWRTDEPPT